MKRVNKYLIFGLAAFLICNIFSCKKRDLRGEQVTISDITLGLNTDNGRIIFPNDTNYTVTPDQFKAQIGVSFSDAVPKRFYVNMNINNDTVNKLIASGALKNTLVLPPNSYEIPANLDMRFGIDHYNFEIVVDITTIERNYGKNLALGIELSEPTKNNNIVQEKKKAIVIIKTDEVIRPDQIHYVYFTGADSLLKLPKSDLRYEQDFSNVKVPVSLSLGGIAGGEFEVSLEANSDTVQKLIDENVLTNTLLLKNGVGFSLPDMAKFNKSQNRATFYVNVSTDTLRANLNKKVALGVTLKSTTSHLLDTTKKTIVVVLDPKKIAEFDITNEGSTFAVERENTRTGELSPNLVDDDINSKFLLFDFEGVWAQLKFDSPQVAGAYTMTSANDAADRDPKNWQLLGSNDSTNWVILDTRTNQDFSDRFQTNKYYFDNNTAYTYYRLNIQEVAGGNGGLYQQAEWRLIKTPTE